MSVKAYRNLSEPVLEHAERSPGRPCLCYHRRGAWREMSWETFGRRARAVAGGLHALGIRPGDRVAIASANRPEWALADLGSILAGAVVVTVYPTLPADEAAYVLRHSGARLLFAEDRAQAEKVLSRRDALPSLETLVLLDPEEALASSEEGPLRSLADLEAGAHGDDEAAALRLGLERRPEDPLTVIYTSGTTGAPKGVVLSHGNVLSVLDATIAAVGDTRRLQRSLSFLPLAHALERIGGELLPLRMGRTICYARGLDHLAEDFREVRPNYAAAVPRLFEKVRGRILERVAAAPPPARALFRWALWAGERRSEHEERGLPPPGWLALQAELADRLVLREIREALGGRVELLVSGGAPLAPEVARFFHAAGLLVVEAWGATETSAPSTLNTPSAYRFGSVGRPLPGVEVEVAADGELLVRGPNVFSGYLDDPAATAESFDERGFFRTGDVGRRDADGFFHVTDRKKELIITSYGKNVAPQKIEGLLRSQPLVSSCMVHGDGRKHLVALVTVDRAAAAASRPDLAGLAADDPRLVAAVAEEVEAVNATLPSFEQVKAFRLVEPDFSAEGGELTPTLKLRRRVIEERYRDLLDGMYGPR